MIETETTLRTGLAALAHEIDGAPPAPGTLRARADRQRSRRRSATVVLGLGCLLAVGLGAAAHQPPARPLPQLTAGAAARVDPGPVPAPDPTPGPSEGPTWGATTVHVVWAEDWTGAHGFAGEPGAPVDGATITLEQGPWSGAGPSHGAHVATDIASSGSDGPGAAIVDLPASWSVSARVESPQEQGCVAIGDAARSIDGEPGGAHNEVTIVVDRVEHCSS